MSNEGMLICIRSSDSEISTLIASLKTLEVNPPSVPYEVVACAPENDSHLLSHLGSSSTGFSVFRHRENDAAAMNSVIHASTKKWLLCIHPDVLFINPDWCDATVSRLIQTGMGLLGSQPFEQWQHRGESIGCVGDAFLLCERKRFVAVHGFPESSNIHGMGLLLHLRMHAAGAAVGAADLNWVIAHMRRCKKDSEIRSVEETEATLDIVHKERLL